MRSVRSLLPYVILLVLAAGTVKGVDIPMPSVTHIDVTPATESAAVGDTLYFTATAHYNDGSSTDVTRSSTWSTSEPKNSVISGMYMPYNAGTWSVTAEYEDYGSAAKMSSVGGGIYTDSAVVTVTMVPTDVEAVDSTDTDVDFPATGVQMGILGLTGSGNITVEVYSGTTPPGLPGGNPVNKYFTVEAGSGITGFQVIITFSYTDAELAASDITDETTLYCARYDTVAGAWVPMVSTVDTAANTVSCTTTQFSTWGIGGEGGGLPVTLASFNAVRTAGGVALAWQTVAEENCLGFNVIRQDAAGSRVRVNGSLIAAAGAGAYAFTDTDAPSGCVYYLEQVDADGSTSLAGPVGAEGSTGILATADAAGTDHALQFMQESGTVYGRLQVPAAGPVYVSCSALTGKTVSEARYKVNAGTNVLPVLDNVPAGTYLVRISGRSLDITRRVTVIR